ncbi:MAG: fluoride efflux transporter CrcB [Bacteroidales bacterium]
MFRNILWIGIGSGLGGIMRYLLSFWVQKETTSLFPIGTLLVNVLGCFIVGFLYGLFEKGNLLNPELRLFLTVGFCGGFTTFSTFVHENYTLFQGEHFFHFALYAVVSFALGLLAAYLGHAIVKLF